MTYCYECYNCGKEFECQQSITESAYVYCTKETCQNNTPEQGHVHRKIFASGLIFNGSGFHKTDYKK